MFLKGANLIESAWYSVKIDSITKVKAMDRDTVRVSVFPEKALSEENGVDVN